MSDETQVTPEATPTVVNSTDPNTVVRERDEGGKFRAKEAVSETPKEPVQEAVKPEPGDAPEKQVNKTTEYINKLKQREQEARAERQEWERRFKELEARVPKAPEPAAPSVDQFYQDPQKWIQDNTQYAVQQARSAWEQEQEQARHHQEGQRALQSFNDKLVALEATHPGIQEALDSLPQQILTPEFARAIVLHERGPEVAYHLVQNPSELYQLVSLSPQVISLAVDHIASRITAAPVQAPNPAAVPPAKAVTRAPAPVTTLSGAPAVKKSYAQMSQKEYETARRAERKAKGLRD